MPTVGTGKVMSVNEFAPEEITYLTSLPAVSGVSSGRIRYTEEFRRECMRRYALGDSPVRIFRDAGLSPALIGYKRIERCISRWRTASRPEDDGGADSDASERSAALVADGAAQEELSVASVASVASDLRHDAADRRGTVDRPAPDDRRSVVERGVADAADGSAPLMGLCCEGGDMRDLIILQQVRRIDELERELDRVRAWCRERAGEAVYGEGGVVIGRETGAVRTLDVLVVAN